MTNLNSLYESPIEKTQADAVEFCKTLVNGRPCSCPVIVAPGAMQRHLERIHIPPAPAPAGVNVQAWRREW